MKKATQVQNRNRDGAEEGEGEKLNKNRGGLVTEERALKIPIHSGHGGLYLSLFVAFITHNLSLMSPG